jgi:hypothetical protein
MPGGLDYLPGASNPTGTGFPTGAAGRTGNAVLVAGTVTVATSAVTANSVILLQYKTAGGAQGFLSYTISAGTSFTITSSSGTDTSTVSWLIVN